MDQHKRSTLKKLFSGTAVAVAYAAFPATISAKIHDDNHDIFNEQINGYVRGDKSFKAVGNYTKFYEISPENAVKLIQAERDDYDSIIMATTAGFAAAATHNAFNNGVFSCDSFTSKVLAPVLSTLPTSITSEAIIFNDDAYQKFPLTHPKTVMDNFGMSEEKAEEFTAHYKVHLRTVITLSGFSSALLKELFTQRPTAATKIVATLEA